jgi:ABC-type branched-subunit amino acid transport system substrate-binding protein
MRKHLRRLWVIPAAMLVTSACGSRMDRTDIQAAERGGLAAVAASSQSAAAAAPTEPGAEAGPVTEAAVSSVDAAARSTGTTSQSSSATPGRSAIVSGAAAPGAAAGRTAAGPSAGTAAPGATAAKATTPGAVVATGGPATKAPIAVGSVATLSGPLGSFTKDYIYAIGVWVKWKNNHGGVNGHPVRHLITDDAGDPARYNAAVRQMTEEQGAIAFIHNTIGFAGGDLGYITQKRMPIIGHEGGIDQAYESPFVFTPAPSGATYAYSAANAFASVAIPAGKKKLAVLACSDVKLCDTFDKVLTGPETKALGFELVYHARPSLTQPDFTGECISARQAGAEIIVQTLDNNSMLRVARSCARQNYHPLWGYFDNVTLPSVAQDPNTEGAIVAVKAPPWVSNDQPGLAEIRQAFAEVAPGVEVNGAHVNGWVSAKTFDVAAKNLPDKATNEDVLNGLWSIQGDSLGGLTYPLVFPKMSNSPKKACWSAVVIKDKKFVATQGSALSCK